LQREAWATVEISPSTNRSPRLGERLSQGFFLPAGLVSAGRTSLEIPPGFL